MSKPSAEYQDDARIQVSNFLSSASSETYNFIRAIQGAFPPTPPYSPTPTKSALPLSPSAWKPENEYSLIPPLMLKEELPLGDKSKATIQRARFAASEIIQGRDDRVIVVVGPCSIHDTAQALEYAKLLNDAQKDWPGLLIIMRSYFEKPRTTVGWKGLINDPNLDGTFEINKGLRMGRQLLLDLTEMGLPVGVELLDTISPQFLADLLSWAAIGARTTASQLHRELASGVSCPVGFKNDTEGNVKVAVEAMRSAAEPHRFLGINSSGLAAIVKTSGNKDLQVILRGGSNGTNYHAEAVQAAADSMKKARPNEVPSIMVDCSHGNSSKNFRNQAKGVASIAEQLAAGQKAIHGVMIESHLNEGRQDIPAEGPSGLKHGVSITDECVNWSDTVALLTILNKAVLARRSLSSQ